jgi:hypothetical protein
MGLVPWAQKKQYDNMTPPKINNSTTMDANESDMDDIPKNFKK